MSRENVIQRGLIDIYQPLSPFEREKAMKQVFETPDELGAELAKILLDRTHRSMNLSDFEGAILIALRTVSKAPEFRGTYEWDKQLWASEIIRDWGGDSDVLREILDYITSEQVKEILNYLRDSGWDQSDEVTAKATNALGSLLVILSRLDQGREGEGE